ncbi:MAG: HlyD family efflux transporter periplasmic adaptor subunit [Cyanobacteria bacterium RM1_2_2]|nr:HlyD family efflux transporter periplasmic adaptor subunit [Cyanobacteria bacterium RM1_2_2]
MNYLNSQDHSSSKLPGGFADNLLLAHSGLTEDFLADLDSYEAARIYGGVASPQQPPDAETRGIDPANQQPSFDRSRISQSYSSQRSSNYSAAPEVSSLGNTHHPAASGIYLWSESLQTVLDQPPAALPARLMLGGVVFGTLFAAWAWLGQVQEVSHAQGKLAPQGEVYKVQPLTQAELAKIVVEEGQSIKKGQVIAELDSRLAIVEIERLVQARNGYQLQLIQTRNLIDRTYLEGRTRQAIAEAEAQAQQAAIAQSVTDAATNREMLAQLDDEIAAYQVRLGRLNPLVQAGALAQDHLFEVEQSLRDRQQTITQTQGKLEQSLSQADQMRAGLAQKQAEGERSVLEVRQQVEKLELEASQLAAKITETETLLKAAQTKLAQMFLYSPVDGTISALNVDHQGEIVQAGQTIAEIAPNHAPLVLSAVLPSQEAGLVKEGMPVQMKFDAFPYQNYGIVSGTVESISPDAKSDEKLGVVYQVKISLDQAGQNQAAISFKAGQTATAEIVVRRRRIMEILLEPIRKLQKGGISL